MAKKTIIVVLVLLAIAAVIYWVQQNNNQDTADNLELTVSAVNQTQNLDATQTPARASDVIVYTLSAENRGSDTVEGYVFETNIADISELATLIDAQGANYNASNNALMWTPQDVPGNSIIQKQFSVRVKDNIPADSDLVMSVRFNNEVVVGVTRGQVASNSGGQTPATPAPVYVAPTSGPSLWFSMVLALVFTFGIILYRTAKRISV